MGDTSANPDASYVCGAEAFADDNVTVVAYVTVAGSNASEAKILCSTLSSSSSFREVTSMSVSGTAACYLTTAHGTATARVYTAPNGSLVTTDELCSSLLNGAGISATPTPQGVTYACTGSAPDGVSITYGSDSSNTAASALPFQASSSLDSQAEYYDITAQLQGSGSITCTLTVQSDVSGTVTKEGSATGGYEIASVEICSDFTGGWQTC
jgi:hypothetical protein